MFLILWKELINSD